MKISFWRETFWPFQLFFISLIPHHCPGLKVYSGGERAGQKPNLRKPDTQRLGHICDEKREQSEAIGQEKENMDKAKNGGLCYRWKFLWVSRSNMNISSTLPSVLTKGKWASSEEDICKIDKIRVHSANYIFWMVVIHRWRQPLVDSGTQSHLGASLTAAQRL